MTTDPEASFDERQTWWWRFLTPYVLAFACAMWSLIGLWSLENRDHQELYGLLGHTDPAGIRRTFWKPGGEHYAFLYITLPFYCGLAAIVISLLAGSVGIRRRVGWTIGYWFLGLFCAAAFSLFMGWLWINAIGLFIPIAG